MNGAALSFLAKTLPPAAMASAGQGLRYDNQHIRKLKQYHIEKMLAIMKESASISMTLGRDEISHEKRSLVPPCQDPPTRLHRLRTDKDCAMLTYM